MLRHVVLTFFALLFSQLSRAAPALSCSTPSRSTADIACPATSPGISSRNAATPPLLTSTSSCPSHDQTPTPASDTTSTLKRRGTIHFVGANEFHNLRGMAIASSVFPIHGSSRYIISIQSTVPTLQIRLVASPDLATVTNHQLQGSLNDLDFDDGQGGVVRSWATHSGAVTQIFVPTSDSTGAVLVEFLDFWASGWIAVWSEEK